MSQPKLSDLVEEIDLVLLLERPGNFYAPVRNSFKVSNGPDEVPPPQASILPPLRALADQR